jgi:hypothetical protein
MASLTEIFNPTFFIFLGILVLVVALLVIYFESKIRDQNHKIASMLSLVSTLAEDINGVKLGLNHLAMVSAGGSIPHFQQPLEQKNMTPFVSNDENKLIEVSDDDDDGEEDTESDINESILEIKDDDGEEDTDDESDNESYNESINDIKVLKLNINNPTTEDIDESENLDLEEALSVGEFDELDSEPESVSSKSSKLSAKFIKESLELKYNESIEERKEQSININASDLKTININLEETQSENIDFKKLSLPKLRSIVSEKGLANDTSKLKKNELLKLLGVE